MFKPRRSLILALTIVLCSGVVHARQFQSSDVETPDHPAVRSVAFMGELMRQRSSGRLWISDVGASDHNSELFTVAQLRTGTLDMARISVTALHGSVPITVVPTLPFLFASVAHRRRILDGPVGAELLASLEAFDLIGLCFYDAGSRSIYMPTKAVRTPADMKGLKIRVQTSPVMAEVMQALGAIPVPVPYGQVRARLAAGTVDAAENNIISYYASRHHEVAKVYSLTEHVAPPAIVVFSKRVWDRLPAEDRDIVRRAAQDSVPYFRKLVDEQEATARSALAQEGVTFVTDVDKAAFVRLLTPLYPKLVTSTRHRDLIDQVRAGE